MRVTESSAEETNNSFDNVSETFYNPLCLSGYLTPLQRKKLREKRNFHSDSVLTLSKPINLKKTRGIKQKKEHSTKERRTKRSKDRIPQIQCTAAKIILRAMSSDEKTNKFFKTSSLSRLEKANFTMPLVFKKNDFLGIEKCVKQTLSRPRKHDENSFLMSNSSTIDTKSPDAYTPQVSANSKEVSRNNCRSLLQPCVSDRAKCNDVRDKSPDYSAEEKSLFDFDWPSDELLLRRQAKARAVLKSLNYQRESKVSVKQNDLLNEESSLADAQPTKLYPIFHLKQQTKDVQPVKGNPKNLCKKKLDSCGRGEQMIIDAGQKEIGTKICKTCNMIYTVGHEYDERLHSNYHQTYLINLKFPGWKEENVIGEYGDGRVIMVKKDDKSIKLKKIEDILIIANRDLGFPSSTIPVKPDLMFVLFISSAKQVAGCLVAEPISSACQVVLTHSEPHPKDPKEAAWKIGNWYSSSETVPALCGINRIWVAHRFRRCKVASRMIDCLRCNFIHGHVVGIRELAFTDPSPSGRAFAAAYTGTDNFLVYK